MTEIVNTDEHEAWNGDSGRRWVADADRRDRVLAPSRTPSSRQPTSPPARA